MDLAQKIKENIWGNIKKINLFLRSHWKPLSIGFAICLVVVVIIFSLPLKTVTVETTRNYYETEVRQEPYTEQEAYLDYGTNNNKILVNGFYQVVPNGVIIPFTIDKPNARIMGQYDNSIPGRFAVLGIGDRIVWETMGSRNMIDLLLPQGEYKALFKEDVMWGEDCYIFLIMQWGDSEPTIKYKEVTKYRQVPVQVEKQETVKELKRITLWQYIFQ